MPYLTQERCTNLSCKVNVIGPRRLVSLLSWDINLGRRISSLTRKLCRACRILRFKVSTPLNGRQGIELAFPSNAKGAFAPSPAASALGPRNALALCRPTSLYSFSISTSFCRSSGLICASSSCDPTSCNRCARLIRCCTRFVPSFEVS